MNQEDCDKAAIPLPKWSRSVAGREHGEEILERK
jgi:hypothetical protein